MDLIHQAVTVIGTLAMGIIMAHAISRVIVNITETSFGDYFSELMSQVRPKLRSLCQIGVFCSACSCLKFVGNYVYDLLDRFASCPLETDAHPHSLM